MNILKYNSNIKNFLVKNQQNNFDLFVKKFSKAPIQKKLLNFSKFGDTKRVNQVRFQFNSIQKLSYSSQAVVYKVRRIIILNM